MAQTATSLLCQPFTVGSTQTIRVVDPTSPTGRDVTIAAQTYRTYLATTGGSGTEASPVEWVAYLQGRLNAGSSGWTVSLKSTGLIRISHTGLASIDWDGGGANQSAIVRNATGFDANVSVNASSQDAAYPPMYALLGIAQADASDWQASHAHLVGAELPDGTANVWQDAYQRASRTYVSRFHARDATTRAAQSAVGSPMWPAEADTTRWLQPSATPAAATTPPWTAHEFLATAVGKRLAFALGTFQDHVGGSATRYDVGYLLLESARRPRGRLTVPGWNVYYDVELGLTLVTRETR